MSSNAIPHTIRAITPARKRRPLSMVEAGGGMQIRMDQVVPQIVRNVLMGALLIVLGFVPAARAEAPATRPTAPSTGARVRTYHNPLNVRGADPFVFHQAGVYYLYATSAGDGIRQWTSKDLVHWVPRGYAFQRTEHSWGRENFWAPEMFKQNGKYYLHFTALGPKGIGHRRIVLSEAASPLGPFHEVKAPWFDDGIPTIDSHVFRDTDGQLYLYAVHLDRPPVKKTFEIVVHRLTADLTPEKKFTVCLFPDKPWEGKPVSEGPFVQKHDGTYFLTYSTFGYGDPRYRVCLAISKSPLGPWSKVGVILKRAPGVSGPGHHCFIDSPDGKEMFIVYHEHRDPTHPGGDRVIAIDRAHFVDGPRPTIKIDGPTLTPQPMPSGSPEQ
jgi:beta-xylosidase